MFFNPSVRNISASYSPQVRFSAGETDQTIAALNALLKGGGKGSVDVVQGNPSPTQDSVHITTNQDGQVNGVTWSHTKDTQGIQTVRDVKPEEGQGLKKLF
ncbi:MAG: hypothetical protein SFZ03_03685 [Candidatus Melainabacteria bacterium]|nr:hypothetical protein [Candidatus Melainabacteria bacterium]